MSVHYAVDFGTTNTVVASDREGAVSVLAFPEWMAERIRTPVVPSAVCFRAQSATPYLGQQAVLQNAFGRLPGYAQGFKRYLGRERYRVVARWGERDISARRAGEVFFDGLRSGIHQLHAPRRPGRGWWDLLWGQRSPLIGNLTLSSPVDADEYYRGELSALGRRLGARTLHLVDEPVAAALGYGVNVGRDLTLLVVDWGGGTLDVSVVRTGPETLSDGRAQVLAKGAAPVGGDDVDHWIVERFVSPLERFVHDGEVDAYWEAARVKELAGILGAAAFRFRDRAEAPFTRDDLIAILEERGAYRALEEALRSTLDALQRQHGLGPVAIDEVLLVGGSCLLPGVESRVRQMAPQARLGEWNPFAAVAMGACEFGRGGHIVDQVYHDYALRMADDACRSVYYELIFPAGSPYPSEPATREYLPDPGSPDLMVFEICEIARLGRTPVEWREEAPGRRVWRPTDPADHARAVVINEGNTSLRLFAARARNTPIQVSYRLDRDRRLRWTVLDGEALLKDDLVLGRLR